jgi:hypothetical protein
LLWVDPRFRVTHKNGAADFHTQLRKASLRGEIDAWRILEFDVLIGNRLLRQLVNSLHGELFVGKGSPEGRSETEKRPGLGLGDHKHVWQRARRSNASPNLVKGNIVQPALSMQIRALEDTLGVRIPGITYRPLAASRYAFRMVLLSRSGETSGAVNAFLKVVRAQSAERRGGG